MTPSHVGASILPTRTHQVPTPELIGFRNDFSANDERSAISHRLCNYISLSEFIHVSPST